MCYQSDAMVAIYKMYSSIKKKKKRERFFTQAGIRLVLLTGIPLFCVSEASELTILEVMFCHLSDHNQGTQQYNLFKKS